MRDVIISIAGLVALAIVWGGWQVWQDSMGGAVACTAEAKLCPDGLAVGRTGPRCEFAPCPPGPADYRDALFIIDGVPTTLGEGGTRYFGNEAEGDLNGDGVSDVAFLITYDGGGSGTFYYAVAALKTADGYQGTNAILLGDRIAPQTTGYREGGIIIVNFADRGPDEPMTTAPHIGVSAYLHIQDGQLVETLND